MLQARLIRADDGKVVAKSQKQGPMATLGVRDVMASGEYLLSVTGETADEQGPYQAQIFQYAPCPAGDDRFEENDAPAQAATLPKQAPMHRHLRICDRDRDFFKVEPGKKGKISWGLRRSRVGAEDAPGDDNQMSLDLLDESGDKMLAEGKAPKTPRGPATTAGAPKRPERPAVDSAVTLEDFDGETALLRASGDADFYHLVQLDPQQQNQNDKNKKNDQNKDDGENDQKDQQDSDQNKDDGESKGDKKKDKDEKSDQKDKSDKPEPSEEDEKKAEEKAAREAKAKKDPEQQRTEDILRALEEHDSNFQMRKALEDMPERDIERDW